MQLLVASCLKLNSGILMFLKLFNLSLLWEVNFKAKAKNLKNSQTKAKSLKTEVILILSSVFHLILPIFQYLLQVQLTVQLKFGISLSNKIFTLQNIILLESIKQNGISQMFLFYSHVQMIKQFQSQILVSQEIESYIRLFQMSQLKAHVGMSTHHLKLLM